MKKLEQRLTWVTCAAVLGTAACAAAQPAVQRDRREIGQDHRELRQDAAAQRDDWRDLKRLEMTLGRFDTARATNNPVELRAVDDEVRRLLAAELAEGRAELAKDRAEVRRDVREVRRDRREIRRDEERRPREGAPQADRREFQDDQRDLRQDVRDVRVEQASQRRTWAIASEYEALSGHMDGGALAQKRLLLTELIGLARQELRQDRREIREDRRELREDRRELRDDARRNR